MNAATLIHPTTWATARRADRPRRGPRTGLLGAAVRLLLFALLAGTFLLDVARGLDGPAAGPRTSPMVMLGGHAVPAPHARQPAAAAGHSGCGGGA